MRTQGHVASASPRCVAGGLTWYAAFAWLLVGCPGDKVADHDSGVDSPDVSADADGDGYATPEDCDDTDPGVNPGAEEICDGLDQDCDGLVDDDPVDGQSWYADADGDSYGDPSTAQIACDGPAGTVASNTDCDDGDPGVNPGATEVCDGVDQDCDGVADDGALYGDADGDGYGDADTSYALCDAPSDAVRDDTDCDDTDSGVHPGASETWYDGEDTDCAGDDDYDADGDGHTSDSYGGDDCDDTDAESRGTEEDIVELGAGPDCGTMVVGAMVYGEAAEDWAGTGLSGGGDTDGDGVDDLVVGAAFTGTGMAYVVLGPISGSMGLVDAQARIEGQSFETNVGAILLGPRDYDGDGYGDVSTVAYGVDNLGWAYSFYGPVAGALSTADATGYWEMESTPIGLAAMVGDTDGDGFPDALIGADRSASWTGPRGAYLLTTMVEGAHSVADAAAWFTDDDESTFCPVDLHYAGDVGADGFDDVIIGCMGVGTHLFDGPMAGNYVIADADATIDTEWVSGTRSGDFNQDGYSDVVVSSWTMASDDADFGVIFVIDGPLSGAVDPEAAASTRWDGTGEGGRVDIAEAGLDLDGSGKDDLVIRRTEAGSGERAAILVSDPDPGTFIIDDAGWGLRDGGRSDWFLGLAAAVGDLNRDGIVDLAVGEAKATASATEDGIVWVLFGGTL